MYGAPANVVVFLAICTHAVGPLICAFVHAMLVGKEGPYHAGGNKKKSDQLYAGRFFLRTAHLFIDQVHT